MLRRFLRTGALQIALAVGLLFASVPGWAGSGATFTLGLSAEYLSDSQIYEGVSAERSNLMTMVWVGAAGHIIDPRFLVFDASVAKTLSNQTISGQTDSDVDETYFDGSLHFFNNRAISFEIGAGRQGTDITGLQQGAIVDGVREYQRYGLRALGGQWFRLNLRRWEQSFNADQPDTLRDEDTSWSELSTQATAGKVDALLQLLWKENDLYGGGLQQEIGTGRMDVDINQSGKVWWHTDLIGNVYRSARGPWRFFTVDNQLSFQESAAAPIQPIGLLGPAGRSAGRPGRDRPRGRGRHRQRAGQRGRPAESVGLLRGRARLSQQRVR